MKKTKGGSAKRKRAGISTRTAFDSVLSLEADDARAERRRRAAGVRGRERSEAAQSQSRVYASLVECRIMLQRALQQQQQQQQQQGQYPASSKEGRSSAAANSGAAEDGADGDSAADALSLSNELLTNLLEARRKLIRREDDEDSTQQEDDDGGASVDYAKLVAGNDEKRLDEVLQSEYESCREEWREVLDRRYKDVRLHAGLTAKSQFRVLDSSFWQQIESSVQHEQLQRQQRSAEGVGAATMIEFDDAKVYQQMLKDFVTASQGSGDVQAAQLRLRKQQKQASASSKKPDVDRKASKGRKIRYQEIPKLVNFTFPLSRPSLNSANKGSASLNLDEDEWFRSLFGGVGRNSTIDKNGTTATTNGAH